jgi:hypothetical protein
MRLQTTLDARGATAELTMAGGPGAGPRAPGHERTKCWIGG